VLGDVAAFGVPPDRIIPVVNQAPHAARARARLAAAIADLASGAVNASLASPVFLPSRKIEEAQHDGVPLPGPLPQLMAGAFRAVLERAASRVAEPAGDGPERVLPGSLGSWGTTEAAGG